MNKIYTKFLLGLLFVLGAVGANAQVTVTNPTNTTPNLAATYGSLAAAVTAVNATTAISGPVTITLDPANPQTAPAGGYSITAIPTGASATNKIVFEGSGNTITAFTPQTSGNINDAIFKLIGADFITIQNFTMQENAANTTTAAATNNMTEFGVALFYASTTNGAQNNTIQNCTISLTRTYTNTFGIYSNTRTTATAMGTAADASASSGSNSGNKIYTNAISNVNYGIVFIGTSTAAAFETGNDIGGSSSATGNTLTNWGGAAAASTYLSLTGNNYCIFSNHQVNDNISYNTITSAALTSNVTEGGILKNYSTTQPTGTITTTINNNTVTVTNNSTGTTTGSVIGINSQGLTPLLSTATMSMNNNLVQNCVLGGSTATTASITGITNLSLPGTMNITGNSILNNTLSSTAATTGSFTAISNSGAAGTLNITSNIIRGYVNNTSASYGAGSFLGISNSGAVVTTLNINSNQIGNSSGGAFTYNFASASAINNGIQNTAGASTCALSISNNAIQGFSSVSASSTGAIVITSGFVGANMSLNSNNIGTTTGGFVSFGAATSGQVLGINNAGGSSSSVLTMTGNDIRGITYTVAGSGSHTYLSNSFAVASLNISTNTFTNLNVNTTGSVTFISHSYSIPASGSQTINGNSIVTAFNKGGAGGTVTVTTTNGSSPNGTTSTVTNNNFSNITVTGATAITGFNNTDGSSSSATKICTGNTLSNWTGGTSAILCINYGYIGATTSIISNNTITNIAGQSSINGISIGNSFNGATTLNVASNTLSSLVSSGTGAAVTGISCTNTSTTININNNAISTLSSTGASAVTALSIGGATTTNVFKNTICDISGSNASSTVNGILVSAGTTINVHNNRIGDLRTTTANASNPLVGLNITGGTTVNAYYNTVNLAATSSGALFGSSAISASTSPTLTLNNNIFANTSTANGAGLTVAYRRSTATLGTYTNTSNRNDLFATTIYYDGTTSYTTIGNYITAMATRDANSISENPPFLSTTCGNANFLKINTATPTQIESGGVNIAGITDDFENDTRQGNPGYAGTGTAPDMGADEFNGSPAVAMTYVSSTTTQANTSSVLTNTTNQVVVGIEIVTSGSISPLSATSFTVNTNGTTNPATDISNMKIYYTGVSSTFAASNQFGSTVASPSGSIAVPGTQVLAAGTNYFWVTYDIPCTASVGNIIDAECNSLTVGGTPQTPTVQAPAGSRTIALGTLSGTYTVGSGGNYATLTAAAAVINAGGLSGNTTLSIIGNVTEPGMVTLNQWSECSPGGYTLTIKPATGVSPTISTSSTSAVIKLNGADRVTIDGSNATGGTTKDMTITNTNTGTSSAVIWVSSASASDGATNNIVKNCIITGNASTTTLMGIFSGGTTISTSGNALIGNTNNTYQNNTISKAQYGIYVIGVSTASPGTGLTISNNNLGSSTASDGFSIEGIHLQNLQGPVVSGNDVQNIFGTSGSSMQGIYLVDTRLATVSANKIHNIVYSGASTTKIYGLSSTNLTFNTVGTPSSNTFVNNAVYDFTSNCNSTVWTLSGINNGGGYGDMYYYNTVYIATTLGGTYPAAAFANGQGSISTFCTNIDIRDNIMLMKASATTSSASLYAFHTTATTLTGSTFNYNDLYSATPGTGSAVYYTARFNSTNYSTLANWQTASGQEANSIGVDPLLNSATNLQPQPGSPVLGAGNTTGTGVTTDISGITRSSGTPPTGSTIGAYETSADLAGPAISYTALANTCATGTRTLTASISDPSGVPTSGPGLPVLYWRINAGAWNAVTGSFVSGSNYSFTFGSGAVAGNTVQYYIVAQDNAGTPNVSAFPSAGATGFSINPPAVSTPPTTPSSYIINAALTGTYTVGSGGAYGTLTLAVAAYNSACLTGPVTFSLTDANYASETYPITINANADASSTNTLTIKPASGVSASFSGSSATALIVLNGADYVTINGSNGAVANTVCPVSAATRNLTLTNTVTNTTSDVIWLSSNGADGATNNKIINCNIVGNGGPAAATFAGIFSGGTGGGAATAANNNNQIINNNISKCYYGVFTFGVSAATKNTGTIINQNVMNTASPNQIGRGGIIVLFEDGITISGNNIGNISGVSSNYAWGISLGLAALTTTTTTGSDVTNATVTKNVIGSIRAASTYGVGGIQVASVTSGTTLIANNMISDAFANGTASDIGAGIYIGGGTGSTTNMYFNSITMASTLTGGSYSNFGIAINGSNPTVNMKNNIVVNTGSNGYNGNVALGFAYSTFTNLVSDNNDLFVSGTSSAIAQTVTLSNTGFTSYTTLANWQAAFSKDLLSKNISPVFTSATDLHINASNTANILNLNGTAATGTGVTDDIDCDSRATLPDIGADQFAAIQIWTGTSNTDYGTGTNWLTGVVPSAGDDNTIPTALTNYPVLDVNRTIGNLIMGANTTMDINGKTLTISGGVTATNTGTLTGSATSNLTLAGTTGTVYFTQTSSATRSLSNFTLNGTSATLGSSLDIYSILNVTSGTLNLNAQAVTLKSTSVANTARVAPITGTLSGATNVTVERYIADPGHRAWHLLSAQAVTGAQTIKQAWQENGGAIVAGVGTLVTSDLYSGSNGFDMASNSASVLTHNQATPAWEYNMASTNSTAMSAKQGYMLFVRGDRNYTPTLPTATASSATVLRTNGTLTQGATSPTVTVSATGTGRTLVGNPFASPIDMETVFTGNPTLNQDMYVWDATATGNYGVGAFVLVERNGGTYQQTPFPLPGSPTATPNSRYIHSGQAFFLKATGSDATVVFNENMKTASLSTVNPIVATQGDQQIWANLAIVQPGGDASLADGIRVRYNDAYNANTTDDALKMGNFAENISSYRESKKLIVEKRPMISKKDTIFLRSSNLGIKDYRFMVGTIDFVQTGVTAYLEDTYKGSKTTLDLKGTINNVDFSVTADAASANPDRFRIVFAAAAPAPAPASITTVKAAQQNNNIAVDWKVTNQQNIAKYEVEKSTDGVNFTKATTQQAITATDAMYNWLDVNPVFGNNYYRIRSIDNGAAVKISDVVKVTMGKGITPSITVYPNPVVNKTMTVLFTNMDKGTYQLRLISNTGAVVNTQQVLHNGGTALQPVILNRSITAGMYQLEIINPDKSRSVRAVVITN